MGLRRISVNCFGFGGSNSHVILDDAFHTLEALDIKVIKHTPASFYLPNPANGQEKENRNGLINNHDKREHHGRFCHSQTNITLNASNDTPNRHEGIHTTSLNGDPLMKSQSSASSFNPRLLIWSAKDEAGLKRVLQSYGEYYDGRVNLSKDFIEPLAYTLSARRSLMSWRSSAVISKDAGGSADTLKLSPLKPVRSTQKPEGITFVFTGQGAQYAKMGLGLLAYPVFHDVLSRASDIVEQLGAEWSLWGK